MFKRASDEVFNQPTKKIKQLLPTQSDHLEDNNKLPFSQQHKSAVIIELDTSLGSSILHDHYQAKVERDMHEYVILQLMKDYGDFINEMVMKNIPHLVPFERLSRERGVIFELIREGNLYGGMHGTFQKASSYFKKDNFIKKELFTKHAFETDEQYKEFIMNVIYYDRDRAIYDVVTDSLREDFEFSLRATLICPKILYNYPERFLNLKFALEYSKREMPKTVMRNFLKDKQSPILESEEYKEVLQFQETSFVTASKYVGEFRPGLYSYKSQPSLQTIATYSPGMDRVLTFEMVNDLYHFFELPQPTINISLKCPPNFFKEFYPREVIAIFKRALKIRDLENPQFVRNLGLILGYRYRKK